MTFEGTLKYNFAQKDVADKKAKERKINLLLLIQHFLKSEGYIESYHSLLNESKIPDKYEICDNMELNHILQDYETYYFLRFQKYPKISKVGNRKAVETEERKTKWKKPPPQVRDVNKAVESSEFPLSCVLSVESVGAGRQEAVQEDAYQERLPRPLSSFEGYSDEWRAMADLISREILGRSLDVTWEDVVGLDEAKSLLKEAIVYPMKYPQVYTAAITPWRGLLLYGPSGTGKTLLAKAVASECNTTFFNISASSIVSKWRGDSEKLVRVMFELARLQAPSTIFVDELDAIASRRDTAREHEASRRLKSELLVQLDGLCHSTENVFFLTTSNLPWDLDIAILRRLEKRIYVGLPEAQAREKLIQMYLPAKVMDPPLLVSNLDYTLLASKCEGYSGADIKLICKEVKMAAVRQVFCLLENNKCSGDNIFEMKLKSISVEDFNNAKDKVKSSVVNLLHRYLSWGEEFGS